MFTGYACVLGSMVGILSTGLSGSDEGQASFISDGWARFSVLSTVLYGSFSHSILIFRLLGVWLFVEDYAWKVVCFLLAWTCVPTLLLSLRYDMMQGESHVVPASIAAVATLLFQALVMVFNGRFEHIKAIVRTCWALSLAAGVSMCVFAVIWFAQGDLSSTTGDNPLYYASTILEFISVEFALILDLLLIYPCVEEIQKIVANYMSI